MANRNVTDQESSRQNTQRGSFGDSSTRHRSLNSELESRIAIARQFIDQIAQPGPPEQTPGLSSSLSPPRSSTPPLDLEIKNRRQDSVYANRPPSTSNHPLNSLGQPTFSRYRRAKGRPSRSIRPLRTPVSQTSNQTSPRGRSRGRPQGRPRTRNFSPQPSDLPTATVRGPGRRRSLIVSLFPRRGTLGRGSRARPEHLPSRPRGPRLGTFVASPGYRLPSLAEIRSRPPPKWLPGDTTDTDSSLEDRIREARQAREIGNKHMKAMPYNNAAIAPPEDITGTATLPRKSFFELQWP